MSTEKFSFGNETCNPHIEVDVFEPVCAHDEIPGSEPLTLEVPVPTFVPIVPPPECTCLTFQQSDSISKVSMTMRKRSTITDKSPLKNTARTTIKAQGDCCDGTYDIGTWITLEVPECLHADGLIDSKTYNFNDDADSGISGSITVETWMKDCVPVLKVTGEPLRVHIDPPIIAIPPLCIEDNRTIMVKPVYYTRDADGELVSNGDDQNYLGTPVTMTVTENEQTGCKQLSFTGSGDAANTVTLDLTGISTFGNGGSVFQADDLNLYTDGSAGDGDTWHGGGLGDRKDDNGEQYVERRGPKMRGGTSPWGSGADYFIPRAVYKNQNDTSKLTITSGNDTATEWRSSRRLGEGEEAEESGIATGNLSMVLPAGLQWHTRGIALTLSHFLWNPSGLLSSMNETGVGALVSPAPTVFADNAKRSISNSATRSVGGFNASGLRINPPVTPTAGNSWYGFEGGLDVNDGGGLRVFGADYKTAAAEIGDANTAPDSRFGKLEVFGHSDDFAFNYDGKLVINDKKTTKTEGNTLVADELKIRLEGATSKYGPYLLNNYARDKDCTLALLTTWVTNQTDDWGERVNPWWNTFKRKDSQGNEISQVYKVDPNPIWDKWEGADDFLFQHDGENYWIRDILQDPGFLRADVPYPSIDRWETYVAATETSGRTARERRTDIAIYALANACIYLQDAITEIINTISQIAAVQLHFSKAGTLMAADTKETCADSETAGQLTRHYQASAPTP